jgi:uncharacterized protein (UPF0335 family)
VNNNKLNETCSKIAALETKRAEFAAEIKAIKSDAKSDGYDPALIAKTVKLMMMEEAKRKKALDQLNLFDSYLNAVGLTPDD